MKILLTGYTGFLGSALLKKLNNYQVYLTSRKCDEKISFPIYKKVISSSEDFSDCLNGVEVVIHLAARVHQMNDKSENPLKEFMETNCHGTLNLAMQAAKAGVKRFIFVSSIKVNGERSNPGKPFRFDDPIHPSDPYGISKANAEEGLLKIAKDTKLEVTIIRPPLIYGPNVKANFASMLKLAKINFPVPLGSIKNKRSFVGIDNLVDLIITCINHCKAGNQIFLVSDNNDVSTSKLYSLMAQAYGNKPRLISISTKFLKLIGLLLGKKEAINRLCEDLRVDIWHTKKTLNWSPVVSLEDGIKNCVADKNYKK